MYQAFEDLESGVWGVSSDDPTARFYYDAEDMNEAQSRALADAHNAGVEGFDEALDWLKERGIDWAKL